MENNLKDTGKEKTDKNDKFVAEKLILENTIFELESNTRKLKLKVKTKKKSEEENLKEIRELKHQINELEEQIKTLKSELYIYTYKYIYIYI